MDLVLALAFVSADVVTAAFTQADCPHQPVDVFMGGVCYWKSDPADTTTFLGARKKCRQQGGDVAVLPDQAVIDALFPDTTSTLWHYINIYDGVAYGGDEGLERGWMSSLLGVTQFYLPWRHDQPGGYADGFETAVVKDCVIIRGKERQLADKPCMFNVLSGNPMALGYACSYDTSEPTHACITNGDCLSDHYQTLHHKYLEGVDANGVAGYGIDNYGTVTADSQIECGVSCHNTPGCENIKWNPVSKMCEMLGHLTMTTLPYTDTQWQLLSRYRFYNHTV